MTIVRLARVLIALVAAFVFTPAVLAQQDLDCANFPTQRDAQLVLEADLTDPNDLDRDDDGIACEDRFGGGSRITPLNPTPTTPNVPSASSPTAAAAPAQQALPATGAADAAVGFALAAGALMLGAGVTARTVVRRRQM